MAEWFEALRWMGVVYLIALGISVWRTPAASAAAAPSRIGRRKIVLRGFLVAITNPKTLLFYGAFLPQFISPDRPAFPQLVILSLTFVAVALLGDSAWAILAGRARRLLARSARIRNRITGAVLIGAGLGFALARKS